VFVPQGIADPTGTFGLGGTVFPNISRWLAGGARLADVFVGRRPTVSIFSGGTTGGTFGGGDWASAITGLGNGVLNLLAQKQQVKALKKMQRIQMRGAITGPGGATGMNLISAFAPSGVPATTGGLGAAGGGALAAAIASMFGLPGGVGDILPGGLEESGTGLFGLDLFRPTAAGQRQRMLDATNPATGERQYWRPVGKPVLFAGDVALNRRIQKIARKVGGGSRCAPTFRRRRRRC